MRVAHLRHLRGPNLYLGDPVVIARLELEELTDQETTDHPGFAGRLVAALPGLAGHHCSAGRPGGLLDAMARGTYFGHVTEHLTLELSSLIGREVYFGRTVWAGAPGRYDVVLECPADEPAEVSVVGDLLALAIRTVSGLLAGRAVRPLAELGPIADSWDRFRLGVSTAALARAARRRGIPVRRVADLNMLQLGHGRHRRDVWAAMTDRTSAMGVEVAGDKRLTKRLLEEAGVPVPYGHVVDAAAQAVAALHDIGGSVVVKPLSGHQGRGVHLDLATPAEVVVAFQDAAAGDGDVLVEAYVPGRDYRVLVVGGRVIAAAELTAARVTGDGAADIGTLVAAANADPARGEGHDRPLTRMALGPAELANLARQGHGPRTVPAAGEVVWLRRNANLSTGGTSRDVTDEMHPEVGELARRVAAVVGLDVCGIDLRLADIATPPRNAGVIEVNAAPGLRMHLAPYEGRPRDVAAAVIDRLFPPGSPARVPIVAVTGTNGKTTTVRMISHVLARDGRVVGMACTEGVQVAGRTVLRADASGPRSARMVLADRSVEVAVLETARGGIVRRGLGYDRADVAVITNIARDHLGSDDIESLDDLLEIKALVAEELRAGGRLVLNAEDPEVAALARRPAVLDRAPAISFFSLSPGGPLVAEHVRAGGAAFVAADGWLVELGPGPGRHRRLLPVGEVAGAFGGLARHVVANALAATAACRALGVPADVIAAALRSFEPHTCNPGRGCVYDVAGVPVLVDYAHNAPAVAAAGDLLRGRWPGEPTAVVTLPGDRMDDLVFETAAEIARRFGRVVVYEDEDLRGRAPGEMARLITGALRDTRPGIRVQPAGDLKNALGIALDWAGRDEPILLLYEKLQPVADLLQTLDARVHPDPG